MHAAQFRVNRKTRQTSVSVIAAMQQETEPEWCTRLVQGAYAHYCTGKVCAVPNRSREIVTKSDITYSTPKRVRRALRYTGMVRAVRPSEHSRQQQSCSINSKLLEERDCVLWFDNYFVKHYSYRAASACLDMTAVAICAVDRSGQHWTWPTITTLKARLPASVTAVTRWVKREADWCADLCNSFPLTGQVRIPLDVVRPVVAGNAAFSWRPYDVLELNVASTPGLYSIVRYMRQLRLSATVNRTVHVLLDQNLWWRLMKLLYSSTYYDSFPRLSRLLTGIQPVFGVWHLYKHSCLMVYRQFSIFFASLHQCLTVAQHVPLFSKPRVVTIEWLCYTLLTSLTRDDVAVVRGLHTSHSCLVGPTTANDSTSALVRTEFLQDFLLVALPQLLHLGIMVRNLTWLPDQQPDQHQIAKVLAAGLSILLRFRCGTSTVYIREACVCLELLHSSNASISGFGWQEEVCEALLSRVSSFARHRGAPTYAAFRKLYGALPPNRTKERHNRRPQGLRIVEDWLRPAIQFACAGKSYNTYHYVLPKRKKRGQTEATPVQRKVRHLLPCDATTLAIPTRSEVTSKMVEAAMESANKSLLKPVSGGSAATLIEQLTARAETSTGTEDDSPSSSDSSSGDASGNSSDDEDTSASAHSTSSSDSD